MFYFLYPYAALAKHGIYPCSPAKAVQDFIPTEREESEAWQVLSDLRSRLKVDFFLYQSGNEERLARFQEQVHTMTTVPATTMVETQLEDDDAPLILLLCGERQKARDMLEKRQRNDPADVRSTHRLALLYYADAKHCEETRERTPALSDWKETIAHWVRTLADDEYWTDWCDERRRCYEEPARQSLRIGLNTAARKDVQDYLTSELKELVVSIEREDSRELAQPYHELLTFYEVERAGAEALKDAGSLVLNQSNALVCGPYLLEKLGFTAQLHQTLADLQDQLRRYDELPAATALVERLEPVVGSPILRRLRLYFSSLREVVSLLTLQKPAEALEILANSGVLDGGPVKDPLYLAIKGGASLFREDVAELEIETHVALALQFLTHVPPNLQRAEAAWRKIMRRANESNQRRTAAEAICKQAIGRVVALDRDIARDKFQRLTEAIEILDRANSVLRGLKSDEVAVVLIEKLAERAKDHFLANQVEKSLADSRRAFDLAPEDAFIREQYAFYLLSFARDKAKSGLADEALTMLEQAKRLVDQGLLDYPDDENLKETGDDINTELKLLRNDGTSDVAWAELEQALSQLQPPSNDNSIRDQMTKAEDLKEQGDYAGAATAVEGVLKQKPGYAWAKAEAVEIYVGWGAELLANGEFEQAEQKVKLAAQQGIQTMRLTQLEEEIARTRAMLNN